MGKEIPFLLLGFGLGIVGSILLAYVQLYLSTAGYRIRMTVRATQEIARTKDRTAQRNRYRYSLGVIMGELSDCFGINATFNSDGDCPCLVDFNPHNPGNLLKDSNGKEIDRWDRFNRFVRPVIEDLNPYSFLRWLQISPMILQLNALLRLCNLLESVVCELDASLEGEKPSARVHMITASRAVIRVENTSKTEALRSSYKELHDAWNDWLRVLDSFG